MMIQINKSLGAWLSVNGEAIYDSKPWKTQNDTLTGTVWYTQSKDEKQFYASILEWPDDNILVLGSLKIPTKSEIHLLGHSLLISVSSFYSVFNLHTQKEFDKIYEFYVFIYKFQWKQSDDRLKIFLPIEAHKGRPAWVLKIE